MDRRTFIKTAGAAAIVAPLFANEGFSATTVKAGNLPTNSSSYQALLSEAHKAKNNAYCRYSNFHVGAALLAKDGVVITGCNVENASYGLTMCAERTAIFKAVSMGYKPGDFVAIAIAASADNFSPCGACRQVMNEFGSDMNVIFEFGGKTVITTLADILPYTFKL